MTAAVPRPRSTLPLARNARRLLRRVPVWTWRLLMLAVGPGERARFNTDPITQVHYTHDVDYAGTGLHAHRLDVLVPATAAIPGPAGAGPEEPLPVYVYFHGGGWTSGDKSAVTKYCASQALGGMVVVNVNYRHAPRFHLGHVLQDANNALAWVVENIRAYAGDPERVVLGGDSAGGQIAALLTAAGHRPDLAAHYRVRPALPGEHLKGLVQHCSAVDFSVFFERGFVLSLNFVRMLVPPAAARTGRRQQRLRWGPAGKRLEDAAAFMSPIEWLCAGHPPVFISTSERDYFYQANLNYMERLRQHGIPVGSLVYDWTRTNTEHTWQQDYRFPESQEVYRRVHAFVRDVASAPIAPADG